MILPKCGDNSPGCPFCSEELKPSSTAVPTSAEVKSIQMKWVALAGAPSIDDPSLVCEDNFRDVLFRRHARASACVWTEQCRIVLSSLFGPDPNYDIIPDQDLSIGQPGDVVINNDVSLSQEMLDLALAADAHWDSQPSGLTAVAIRSFIWPNGNQSAVRGYGNSNSGTRPILFIVDHEFLPATLHDQHVNTEQVLAHEIGHALGLCHSNTNGCNNTGNANLENNLMLTPVNGRNRVLVESQCDIARNTIPSVFMSSTTQDFAIASATDTHKDDFSSDSKYLDLHKIVVADGAAHRDGLKILMGTNGLLKRNNATFWLGLDIDNNKKTGAAADALIPHSRQSGVELVVQISINENKQIETNVFKANDNTFRSINLSGKLFKTEVNTIKAFAYSDDGCSSQPVFEEIELEISREAFKSLGLPETSTSAFANGLLLQAVAVGRSPNGEALYDLCPNTPELLEFYKNPQKLNRSKTTLMTNAQNKR